MRKVKILALSMSFIFVFCITFGQILGIQVRPLEKTSLVWSDSQTGVRVYGPAEVLEPGIYSFTVLQGAGQEIKVGSFYIKYGVSHNPTPGPSPPPAPSDVGYTGKLWAVLVLPDNLDDSQASLRTDPWLSDRMKSEGAIYRSYLRSEEEISTDSWKKIIDSQESIPVMLWVGLDPSGKPYLVKSTKWPFTSRDIDSELLRIRGK